MDSCSNRGDRALQPQRKNKMGAYRLDSRNESYRTHHQKGRKGQTGNGNSCVSIWSVK